jgi:hypothetical protein
MTIQFVPQIAASGGYDYLVDFLRRTLREAKTREPERVQELEELLNELGQQIEVAAAQSDAGTVSNSPPAAASAAPATRLNELLRKLTSGAR